MHVWKKRKVKRKTKQERWHSQTKETFTTKTRTFKKKYDKAKDTFILICFSLLLSLSIVVFRMAKQKYAENA